MKIAKGSKVSIHYQVTVDGVVVDSSAGREPLAFVMGEDQIVPGLEEKLMGLSRGAKEHLVVPPEKGYGLRDAQAVHKLPRSAFQEPDAIQVGSVVSGEAGDGAFEAIVVAADAEEITLDLNHPLAGKTLEFDVEVVGIE